MKMGRRNVIILILDTVGYNHTSLGGGPAQMPNLQRWADDNLHLTNYIAPATYTCQSIPSILTGLNALHHCTGMPVMPTWNLPASIRTLFDMLREYGYKCAVIGDCSHLLYHSRALAPDGKPSLAVGRYDYNSEFSICEKVQWSAPISNVEYIANSVIDSVNELTEPYVAMVHTLAPHGPCGDKTAMEGYVQQYQAVRPSSTDRAKYAALLRDIYCHRLEVVDKQIIAPIVDRFSDDFLVIMSDHGVDISRGAIGVGHMAWNTIDSVCCMSYHEPTTYTYPFGGIDILPTICDLLDIPVNHRIDGTSMVDKIENNTPNDRFYHIWSSNCQVIQRLFTRVTLRDTRLPDRWLPAEDRNIGYDDIEVGYWGYLEKHVDISRPMIDIAHPLNKCVNIHDECVAEFIEWYEEQLRTPLYDGVSHVFTRYDEDIPDNRNAEYAPKPL